MSVRVVGDDITVDGQATIKSAPAFAMSAVPNKYAGTLKAYVTGLNLNAAAPIDLSTLTVLSSKYVPVRCLIYNPTANLSGASLGLYTAAAAGGVAIVAPVALASLTAAGKFQSLAIAALTDAVVATVLYPRLTVAAGLAGTASLVLEFVELGLI